MIEFKLWHDDLRPPPDDTWVWARTNAQAIDFLLGISGCSQAYRLVASLDHDLGLHHVPRGYIDGNPDALLLGGEGEETGLDLVKEWSWMPDAPRPDVCVVHSWNPDGARAMIAHLRECGVEARYEPYRMPGREGTEQDRFIASMVREAGE